MIRADKGRVDKKKLEDRTGKVVIELGIGKIELMALGRRDRVRNGEDSSGRRMIELGRGRIELERIDRARNGENGVQEGGGLS